MSTTGTSQITSADIYQLLFMLRRAEGKFKYNDSEFPLEEMEEKFLKDHGAKFSDILGDQQKIELLKEALLNKDKLKANSVALEWFNRLTPEAKVELIELRKLRDDNKFLNDLRNRLAGYGSAKKDYENTKKDYDDKLMEFGLVDQDLQDLVSKNEAIFAKLKEIEDQDKEQHPDIIRLRNEYKEMINNLNAKATKPLIAPIPPKDTTSSTTSDNKNELEKLMDLRSRKQGKLDSMNSQELIKSEIDFLNDPNIKGKSAFQIKDKKMIHDVRQAQILRIQSKLYEEIRTTHENLVKTTGKFKSDGALLQDIKTLLEPGNTATASLTDKERKDILMVLEKYGKLEENLQKFIDVFKKFEQAEPSQQIEAFEAVLEKFDELSTAMIQYVNFYAENDINQIIIPEELDNKIKLAISGTTSTALGFQSYVIQPFQTGLKYQLFAREMDKLTKEGEPLHSAYASFGAKSKKMGDTLESHKAKVEEKSKAIAVKVAIKEADEILKTSPIQTSSAIRNGTKSDVRITLNIKGNKKALDEVKNTLKEGNGEKIGLPENWAVVKRGKKKVGRENPEDILSVGQRIRQSLGKGREYLIKEDGKTVFKVKVTGDHITIKPIKGKELDGKELIRMHQIVQGLNKKYSTPVIHSENNVKMALLMSHGIYQIGNNERKALTSERAIGKEPPIVTIKSKSSQVQEKFQQAINNGYIPRLMNERFQNTEFVAQGNLKGNIEIRQSQFPMVAIKQYEAALAAGFTPSFTESTKAAVNSYVSKQLKENSNNRQITITALPLSKAGAVEGEEICRRVLQATADGLTVNLPPHAEIALKDYMNTLSADKERRYELTGQPDPTIIIKNLGAMGMLPQLPSDSIKAKEMLRQINERSKTLPIIIDSKSNERNLLALKDYLEKGIVVNIADEKKLLSLVKNQADLPTVNLQAIPRDLQMEQVKKLAEIGICGINVKGAGATISIHSANAQHAIKAYEQLLQQGFKPEFSTETAKLIGDYKAGLKDATGDKPTNDSKYEVFSDKLAIKLTESKPALLLSDIQNLCKMGLCPKLDDNQITALQKYIRDSKTEVTIHIAGGNQHAVHANALFAQKIGARIQLDQNIEMIKKAIAIMPVMNKDNKVDIEKTLLRANDIAKAGYNVTLPLQIIERYLEIKDQQRKAGLEKTVEEEKGKFFKSKAAKNAKSTLNKDEALNKFIDLHLDKNLKDQLEALRNLTLAQSQEKKVQQSVRYTQQPGPAIIPMHTNTHPVTTSVPNPVQIPPPSLVTPPLPAFTQTDFEKLKAAIIGAFDELVKESAKLGFYTDVANKDKHLKVLEGAKEVRDNLKGKTPDTMLTYLDSIQKSDKYPKEVAQLANEKLSQMHSTVQHRLK